MQIIKSRPLPPSAAQCKVCHKVKPYFWSTFPFMSTLQFFIALQSVSKSQISFLTFPSPPPAASPEGSRALPLAGIKFPETKQVCGLRDGADGVFSCSERG